MRPELDKQLYEKYPEIFCQKDLDMRQTAMCWGICCGDGWYTILDELCGEIQNHINNENLNIKYKKERGELPPDAPNYPQIEATQVKEKFGGLRFYVNYYDDFVRGLISMAESMSLKTCEHCGNPGKENEEGYWISVLCDPCREEDKKRRQRLNEEARERLTVKMNDVTVAP